jgi:hypothetical protein
LPKSSESPPPDPEITLNLGVQRDEQGRVVVVILDFGEPVKQISLAVEDARRLIADVQAALANAEQ